MFFCVLTQHQPTFFPPSNLTLDESVPISQYWNHMEPLSMLNYTVYHLVGGLEHCLFSHIFEIVIPVDFHIFQRGSNYQPVISHYASIPIISPSPVDQSIPVADPHDSPGLWGATTKCHRAVRANQVLATWTPGTGERFRLGVGSEQRPRATLRECRWLPSGNLP